MRKAIIFLLLLCNAAVVSAQNEVDEALAYQYYQQGDFEKAAISLEQLFNKTNNDNYLELYLNSLLKIKKYSVAEITIKKLIRQQPQKTNYLIALGRIYQETGKAEEANKLFQEAIKTTPKDEFHVRELAYSFYRFEAFDMAINTFLESRKSLNNDQLYYNDLLNLYRFKKDKKRLAEEYVNVLGFVPQLLQSAENSLSSVFEGNEDYQYLQSILLRKIQKEPDIVVYTELLIWQYMQQQDYEMALRQLIAFDRRTKADGMMVYLAAGNFMSSKAFTTAQKAYEYLMTKGAESELYIPSKIQLISVKYEIATSGKIEPPVMQELATAYQEILTQYGISAQTLFAVKKLAYIKAYYLNDLTAAEKVLEQAIEMKSLSATDIAQLKLDLGDIYILTKQPWDAFLLYEQVAKDYETQEIGNEAKFRSAKLTFYQGNFKYAKSQVDVLKASTSKLIANDALNLSLLISDNLQSKNDSLALMMYAEAEMLQFMNQHKEALRKLESINIVYPSNSLEDDVFMAKARIYIKSNELTLAVDLLKKIIDEQKESIWTDDALFTLADLEETKLNNPEEAKKLYQRLINDFPGSMFSAEARKRFRNIRGDNLGT